jgi:GT2 family glycosyltransferase
MPDNSPASVLAPVGPLEADRLTVAIVTRNRVASLLATLDALAALPERPHVVVVDNGSTDGTADGVAARHPGVRVVVLNRNLGAAARTVAAGLVDSDYIAFCDDDSGWAPGALASAARLLDEHPSLGLLAAKVLVGPTQRVDPVCLAMARSPLTPYPGLPGTPILGFVACGAVVRRTAYLEVGGFHPRYGVGGEERLLAVDLAEAGWHLAYVDAVVALHRPEPHASRDGRAVRELRNDLWTAWLRLPVGEAVRTTTSLLHSPAGRTSLRAAVGAAAGLPWVARERRRVSADLAGELRRIS